MLFYVYYDAYGHAIEAITEAKLREDFGNSPDRFLAAMAMQAPDSVRERVTGHVGVLRFDDEEDLREFLQSLGDEINGFYGCEMASRPYNF